MANLDRVQSRKIPASRLELLAKWLDGEPEVQEGLWYKRFSGMTVLPEFAPASADRRYQGHPCAQFG